jgi:uncharacterized protein
MVEAKSAAFLLIAGGANRLEVSFNELFAQTVGSRSTVWVAPEAAHTGAFSRYPDEYEQRVITFFNQSLLNDTAVRDH